LNYLSFQHFFKNFSRRQGQVSQAPFGPRLVAAFFGVKMVLAVMPEKHFAFFGQF